MKRWLPPLANLLIVAYALDAGVSLVEETFRFATGSMALAGLRNGLALLVVLLGLLMLPLLWLTPRLPLILLLCLIGSSLWFTLGAMPLPLIFDSLVALSFAGALIQVAIASASLLWIRRRNGGSAWLFAPDAFDGPLFSLRHSAVFSLATIFIALPLTLAYGLFSVAAALHSETSGFISFDLGGVSLGDRRYVQGDREVRLVGMMHIGEEAAYRELVESFVQNATIVLEEGVSDAGSVMEVPLSYGVAAEALGLDQQGSLGSYLADSEDELPEWPVLRNADIDLRDFSPVTIEWLNWVSGLWKSDELVDVLREVLSRSAGNEEELLVVQHDILDLRNQHLLEEIDSALPDYQRVIVPWGALHLPFIEQSILERGFDESERRTRRLVSWMTVLGAIF